MVEQSLVSFVTSNKCFFADFNEQTQNVNKSSKCPPNETTDYVASPCPCDTLKYFLIWHREQQGHLICLSVPLGKESGFG